MAMDGNQGWTAAVPIAVSIVTIAGPACFFSLVWCRRSPYQLHEFNSAETRPLGCITVTKTEALQPVPTVGLWHDACELVSHSEQALWLMDINIA